MEKKFGAKTFKKILFFIFVLLVIPINTYAALWTLKNVELSDVIIEDSKIVSYAVHFEINSFYDLGQAEGYIGIQRNPFVDKYDDNSYGDFTDYGKVAKEKKFRTLADIINDTDFMSKYDIISFSSDDGEGFPIFGTKYLKIDRKFTDLDTELYESGVYYVYLWTDSLNVYPDALIATIEYDGTGKISVNNSTVFEEKNYYTLRYETNGGSSIASKSIKENEKFIKPAAPTRAGFRFDGWYADEELETLFDFNTEITNSTTIYAKWTKASSSSFSGHKTLSKITDLTFEGYEGLYDGLAHSIIVNGNMDGYTILYSTDGNIYDLSEAPKYTDVGNYTIYYKVSRYGYEDLIGSVAINIKENNIDDVIVSNPATSDNLYLWIVELLSFSGLVIISTKKITA